MFERIQENYYVKFFRIKAFKNQYKCITFGEIHFKDTIKTYEYFAYDSDSLISKLSVRKLFDSTIKIQGQNEIQELKLVEKINLTDPYEMKFADSASIGLCLQQWMLGTYLELNKEQGLFRFMAGTNQHSFMFDIHKGFTYCRAARIKSNNHGTLMAQNIRLYDDGRYKAAIMKLDNYVESSSILKIQNELFNPNACVYNKVGFYWSLAGFDKKEIVLNGCENRYNFTRPDINSNRLIEWIKYKKY